MTTVRERDELTVRVLAAVLFTDEVLDELAERVAARLATQDQQDDWLTVTEAAARLHVPVSRIYRRVIQRAIPPQGRRAHVLHAQRAECLAAQGRQVMGATHVPELQKRPDLAGLCERPLLCLEKGPMHPHRGEWR